MIARRCVAPMIVATLLTASASAQTSPKPGKQPAPDRSVVFKRVGDVEVSLHLFLPEKHRAADRRAAIVFFFGGGWVGGTPRQFYPHARELADSGMVAVSAEYRVRSRHGTRPIECVRDGLSAVRYLRQTAGELGIDPQRIAAGGGSAGGHVAACTGTIRNLDEPAEDADVSSRPDAMVLFNPVVDTGPRGFGHNRLGDDFTKLSPVDHVDQHVPPTIIFHGTADRTVPIENVERFRDKMTAAGNRCELISFDGAGHGFFNHGRADGAAYRDTVAHMKRFLASLGYL